MKNILKILVLFLFFSNSNLFGQSIFRDAKCLEYHCLSDDEKNGLQEFLNGLKSKGINVNVAIYSDNLSVRGLYELCSTSAPALSSYFTTTGSDNTQTHFLICIGPGYYFYHGNPNNLNINNLQVSFKNNSPHIETFQSNTTVYPLRVLCQTSEIFDVIKSRFSVFKPTSTGSIPIDLTGITLKVNGQPINCKDPMDANSLAFNKFLYPYDDKLNDGLIQTIYKDGSIKRDRLELKSQFCTDLVYVTPIPTAANLNAKAKEALALAVSKTGLLVSLDVNYVGQISDSKIYKTPEITPSPNTDATNAKDRCYPAMYSSYLGSKELAKINEEIVGNNNPVSVLHDANNSLKRSMRGYIDSDADGKVDSEGGTDFNAGAKYTKSNLPQWQGLSAAEAGKNFTQKGGYNGAGLTLNELKAILDGIALNESTNAKFKFELITSTNNQAKIPNALTLANEAKTRYNSTNWTINGTTYAGRIWIHEEVVKTGSKATYRIDVKFNLGFPDFPTEIKNQPQGDFTDFENLTAETVGNLFDAQKKGLNVTSTTKSNLSSVLQEVLTPLRQTLTCLTGDHNSTLFFGFFREEQDFKTLTGRAVSDYGWFDLATQFLNLGLSTVAGNIPEEAYMPTCYLVNIGKTPTIFDLGGVTAGSISGVMGLAKNVAIGTAFVSAGPAGIAAGGGMAVVNAISSGKTDPIRDLFVPFIGPIETFVGQMQYLATNPVDVVGCQTLVEEYKCEKLSYETVKATFNFIGEMYLDIAGGKLIGKLSVKLNNKVSTFSTAFAQSTIVSPKLIANVKKAADFANTSSTAIKAAANAKFQQYKVSLKNAAVTTLFAFSVHLFEKVDLGTPEFKARVEQTMGPSGSFTSLKAHADVHTAELKTASSGSGSGVKPPAGTETAIAGDAMDAYNNNAVGKILEMDPIKQKAALEDIVKAAEKGEKELAKHIIDTYGKDKDDPNSECSYCNKTVKNSGGTQLEYLLCKDLEKLKIRATAELPSKLCALPTIQLQPIVTELLSTNSTVILEFYKDINSATCTSDYLCGNIPLIDVDIIKAWKIVYDAKPTAKFKQDFTVLTAVKLIQNSSSKLVAFTNNGGTIATFIQKYDQSRCKICGNQGLPFLPELNDILLNTAEVYETHNAKPGFMGWYNREVFASNMSYEIEPGGEIKNIPSIGRDGAQHMIKYMAERPFADNTDAIDQNFGATATYPNRQFDIKVADQIRFVEFKSYKTSTSLNSTASAEQLMSYLSQIDNMAELRYVFNDKKTNIAEAKTKMQELLNGGKKDEIFNVIWNNVLGLRVNVFPTRPNTLQGRTDALQDFNNMLSSFDNKIYIIVDIN